jgi:hypothetical protein
MGVTNWAHGLGTTPRVFGATLYCYSANAGFAVGNRVALTSGDGDGARQQTLFATSSNVSWSRQSDPTFVNATATGNAAFFNSQWYIYFYAAA